MDPIRNNLQDTRLDKIEKHVFILNREVGTVMATQKIHTWLFGLMIAGLVALIFKAFTS